MRYYFNLFCLSSLVVFSLSFSYAQNSFNKVFSSASNDIETMDIVQLEDSTFVVLSQRLEGHSISKFTKSGVQIWNKKLTNTNYNIVQRMKLTSTNRIVVCGIASASGTFGIVHYDTSGVILSSKTIGYNSQGWGLSITDILEDSTGNIYFVSGDNVIKTTGNGDLIWNRAYKKFGLIFTSIVEINSNKLIVSGSAISVHAINSADEIVQMCIDSQGQVLWSKSFGEVAVSENIVQSFYVDNKIYLFGNDQIVSQNIKNSVLCTDTSGNVLFYKNFASRLTGMDVVYLKDSTFAVTGIDSNVHKLYNINKQGDLISHQRFNFNFSFPASIIPFTETLDSAIVMAVSNLTPGNFNLVKFRLNGKDNCLSRTHLNAQFQNEKNIMSYDILITSANQGSNFNNVTYPLALFALTPGVSCSSNCATVGKIKPTENRVCQGTPINFTNSSLNATGFSWSVNGVNTATTQNFSFPTTLAGLYEIKLVSQGIGCADTTRMSIVVTPNLVPTTFTHESDQRSITVETAVNPDASLRWNFNDSPQEWFVNPITHKYASLGPKQICLTQANICGSQTHCETINLSIDTSYSFLKHYNESGGVYYGRRFPEWTETLADGSTVVGVIDDTYGSAGFKGSLIKVDKKGEPIWTRVHNIGGANYRVKEITELMDGQLIMTGTNGTSVHLCQLNKDGDVSAFKVMTTNVASVKISKPFELPNGNIAFTGSYSGKVFLMITDKSLDLYSTKKISGISSLTKTLKVDDGFILVGSNSFFTRVMKIDFEGNIIYSKRIDLLNHTNETPTDARLTASNQLVILGSANPTSGASKSFLMKLDADLNVIWTKSFAVLSYSFELDKFENIYVSNNYYSNCELIKFDNTGNSMWKWRYIDSQNKLSPRHITKTNEGGLMIATQSIGFASVGLADEVSLMKFDNTNTPPTCEGVYTTTTVQVESAVVYNSVDSTNTEIRAFTRTNSNLPFSSTVITSCETSTPVFEANFTYTAACQGTAFQFQDISNSTIPYTVSWTFQDGTPAASTSSNPSILWSTAGIKSVTLTITSGGTTSTFTQQVTVAPTPTANAGSDLVVCQNSTTTSLSGIGIGTLTWLANPLIINTNNPGSLITPSMNSQFILKATSGQCVVQDTVSLTVLPSFSDTTNVTLCAGDSILFRGNYYSTIGNHPVTFTNVYGCDSTFILNISNYPTASSTDSQEACETFTWINGLTYTSSNNSATYILQSINGCDSTINLNLTIHYNDLNGTQEELRCGEFTWIDGITYTSSTIATYALLTTHGCDSLVTLDLTIIPNSYVYYTETACDYFTWIDGQTYTSDTVVNFVQEPNAAGCDSIAQLTLTINTSTSATQSISACGQYTWIDGVTYTQSDNTAIFTLPSSAGCDSTIYLDLAINENETSTETIEACGSYTWTNGITYTSSNSTATQTISGGAQNGCDLIQQLNLTMTPTPIATVSNASPGFITSNTATSYQWVNCQSNQVINGATAQTFQPMTSGSYAVIQTNAGGCVDTSDCFIFNYIGINEQSAKNEIRLYPNPTKAMIRIDLGNATNGVATLKELNGKIISSKNIHSGEEMNIGYLAAGTYLISVSCNEVVNVFRVVKE